MMIRTLLVDDEEPARHRLRRLLGDHDDVDVVAEAADGSDALEKMKALRPDLVFLDIHMPGCTGMEVAASAEPPRPQIVFCTAFDHYAIDAFELHALDYLLKPVHRDRLARSIQRVRQKLGETVEFERELESAEDVQRQFFPHQALLETLDCSGSCRPAKNVSGDYYDFVRIDSDRMAIAIGDVSGKGVQAALLMASLQGRVQSLAPTAGDDLSGLAERLNLKLWESTTGNRYATLFYSVYDQRSGELAYFNAGHLPALLFRSGQTNPQRLTKGGMPLGLFADSRYHQAAVRLQENDTIVLFTDGVVEAVDKRGEEFNEDRLIRLVAEGATLSAQRLQENVLRAVEDFSQGCPQHDDITVVAARVLKTSIGQVAS